MGEYHEVIRRPQRGIDLRQYVYDVGSYHYNWHPELELQVVLSGEVEVVAAGEASTKFPGDVVVINSGVGHATMARTPGSRILLMHLGLEYFAGLYPDHARLIFECESTPATRGDRPFVLLRGLLAQMMLEADDTSPAGQIRHERHLVELVDTLVQNFPPRSEKQASRQTREERTVAIDRMLDFIQTHYHERISLERLGRHVGHHPGYVSELFSRSTGVTTHEHITRVRLRAAARDLAGSRDKVVDVAARNGFPDVKSFNAAFRRTFGKSPTEYRQLIVADAASVDATFHQTFARRDDSEVTARLGALAQAITPEGTEATPQTLAVPTATVASLAEEAQRLAQSLTEVQHALQRMGGGLV